MDSSYFTRSKACRPSQTSDTPSDVEPDPDDAAPETAISGPVRLPVTAAEELESLPQELAVPPSAPATVEGDDGGCGSVNSLLAGVPLSAPGGQIDPQIGPRAVFDGGWGVEPPAKISDPPAAIKKRRGGRVPMYLCISTVVEFNSQNFDPPNEI